MEPTIRNGSAGLATRWWIDAQRNPERGDIVLIRRPGNQGFYLKRVLGLPGETLAFKDGVLFINGQMESEPWVRTRSDWTLPPVRLGPDEFFVAGDNRAVAIYEQTAGVVHRSRLGGRLIF